MKNYTNENIHTVGITEIYDTGYNHSKINKHKSNIKIISRLVTVTNRYNDKEKRRNKYKLMGKTLIEEYKEFWNQLGEEYCPPHVFIHDKPYLRFDMGHVEGIDNLNLSRKDEFKEYEKQYNTRFMGMHKDLHGEEDDLIIVFRHYTKPDLYSGKYKCWSNGGFRGVHPMNRAIKNKDKRISCLFTPCNTNESLVEEYDLDIKDWDYTRPVGPYHMEILVGCQAKDVDFKELKLLCPIVHIINKTKNLATINYSEDGMDITSPDVELLQKIYSEKEDWITEYWREDILESMEYYKDKFEDVVE